MQLIYYGHFTYSDCENMSTLEFKWFYNELVKIKEAENKAKEEALKSAQAARDAAKQSRESSRGRRVTPHKGRHRR